MKKFLIILFFLTSKLFAQGADFIPPNGNFFGIGVGGLPDYNGSDDYIIGATPAFRAEFGNYQNITYYGGYITSNLLSHPHLRFGPSFNYRFSRDDVHDKQVNQMSKIGGATELGFKFGYEKIIDNNVRHRLFIGGEALFDVSDTHDGYNLYMTAHYWRPVHPAIDIVGITTINYGSEDYLDTYFSVNPDNAIASGLAQYKAKAGLSAANFVLGGIVHLNKSWHIGGGVRYSRLLNDAANSPIVKNVGSKNQYIFGVGIGYIW